MTIVTQDKELINYDNISRIRSVKLTDLKDNNKVIYEMFGVTNGSFVTDSELEKLAIDILNPARAMNSVMLDGCVFIGGFLSQTENDNALNKIIEAIKNNAEIVEIDNSEVE